MEKSLKDEKFRKQAERTHLESGLLQDREDWILTSVNSIWRNPTAGAREREKALLAMQSFPGAAWHSFLQNLEKDGNLSLQQREQILKTLDQSDHSQITQAWIKNWPTFLKTHPLMTPHLAEHYRKNGQWESLLYLLRDRTWGSEEFLRYAYLAHALEQSDQSHRQGQHFWEFALEKAEARPEKILKLVQSLLIWDEPSGLSKIVANAPAEVREAVAWKEMELVYYQRYRSEAEWLERLHDAVKERPDDVVVKNNFAAVALSQGKHLEKANILAAEVFQNHSGNPDIATTYAMSLIENQGFDNVGSRGDGNTNWRHLAFSYDAATGTGNVYLDGTVVGSNTGNPNSDLYWGNASAQPQVRVGVMMDGYNFSKGNTDDGFVDEIRFSNSALEEDDLLITPVPEPSTYLGGIALALFVGIQFWRKRKKSASVN